MKKLIKIILLLFFFSLLSFFSFLMYLTFTDYKPEEQLLVYQSETPDIIEDTAKLSLLLWDISYAGINQEMKHINQEKYLRIPDKKVIKHNWNGIKKIIEAHKQNDFILLQEVDQDSKRSRYYNQKDSLISLLENHHPDYCTNNKVSFLPKPLFKPVGKINSGLLTLSSYRPLKSVRHSFPFSYAYPVKLIKPDQCFLVNRYLLQNNKQLLIVHLHNFLFKKKNIHHEQIKYLKQFIKKEYQKGNYIIVGGNWNIYPPNFKPRFTKDLPDTKNTKNITQNIGRGWKWAYDPNSPTNRSLQNKYIQGKTKTRLTDFFLLSPNISLKQIKNLDYGFTYSDHQPVQLKVQLK